MKASLRGSLSIACVTISALAFASPAAAHSASIDVPGCPHVPR